MTFATHPPPYLTSLATYRLIITLPFASDLGQLHRTQPTTHYFVPTHQHIPPFACSSTTITEAST